MGRGRRRSRRHRRGFRTESVAVAAEDEAFLYSEGCPLPGRFDVTSETGQAVVAFVFRVEVSAAFTEDEGGPSEFHDRRQGSVAGPVGHVVAAVGVDECVVVRGGNAGEVGVVDGQGDEVLFTGAESDVVEVHQHGEAVFEDGEVALPGVSVDDVSGQCGLQFGVLVA